MKLKGLTDRAVERIARRTGMAFMADPPVPSYEKYKGIIEYPGFHTTGSFEIAAQYAIGRVAASFTEEADDGTHYVTDYPVVVALDMGGFQPETDYDAEKIVWDVLQVNLNEMQEGGWRSEGITAESTDDEILDAAQEIIEATEQQSEMDDPLSMIAEGTFWHMNNPLTGLVDEPGFPDAVRTYVQTGEFPPDLLMKATDQYRYTEDVPEERLLAVWYVTPVAAEMGDYDTDEEVGERWPGFDVPWIDDVYSGYFNPSQQLVWGGTESDQLPLFEQQEYQPRGEIEYHGTTLSRLLQAAPHLEGQLPAPETPPYQGALALAARRRR